MKKERIKISVISDSHIIGEDPAAIFNQELVSCGQDLMNTIPDTDILIHCGDVAQGELAQSFDLYQNLIEEHFPFKETYSVMGNHDYYQSSVEDAQSNFKLYTKQEDIHRTFLLGNCLFVFMSTEGEGTLGTGLASQATIDWFEDVVSNNQDKNIFVFAHHAPFDVMQYQTSASHKRYEDSVSVQFERILAEFKVDVWFYGHNHGGTFSYAAFPSLGTFNGTLFCNAAGISTNSKTISTILESRYFELVHGSKSITVKSRDHTNKLWQNLDYTFDLRYNVELLEENTETNLYVKVSDKWVSVTANVKFYESWVKSEIEARIS